MSGFLNLALAVLISVGLFSCNTSCGCDAGSCDCGDACPCAESA